MSTINRTWFKNRLRNGELLVKCTGKYTDDYIYDNAYNYFVDEEFKEADVDLFNDWYLSKIYISGEKNGIISVSFASCEYYRFKIKSIENENIKTNKNTTAVDC